MKDIEVLVIEDEDTIRKFISINLKRASFKVIEAASGEEGIEKLKIYNPDLIVLDIMLPGIDGFEVCKNIRADKNEVPIIMLTAKAQDIDRIKGLEFGADDYMIKPFNPLELVARIKAILRRINKQEKEEITKGIFKIDLQSKKFYKNKKAIELTFREFNLMELFLKSPNKVFSRDELLNSAWGEDFLGDPKTVDVHVRRLREKIEEDSSNPEHIVTVWGHGYCFKE